MKRTIIFFLFTILIFSVEAQPAGSSKDDFLKMAHYLSGGSGKWITDNPNYDRSNPMSSKSFGLWFDLKLRDNLLHLTHVIFRGDTAHVSGESFWLWHPGEKRIKYYSINSRGSFSDGETYFTADDKFVTSEFRYTVDGNIQFNNDENTMISAEQHSTLSSYFQDNEWHPRGKYVFRKDKGQEGYAIKN